MNERATLETRGYFVDQCFDIDVLKYQRENQEWVSLFKGDESVIRKMIV